MFILPRNPEEKKKWITIFWRNNVPDSKDTFVCQRHWPKDYPTTIFYGKLSLRYPPSVFDCIKRSLLSTVPSAPRKTVRAHCKISHTVLDELCLFEKKKTELELLTIFFLVLTIVLLCIDAMKNWLFSLQTFWCNLPYQIFHYKSAEVYHLNHFNVVLSAPLTVYLRNTIYAFSRLSYIHKALRYQNCSEMTQKSISTVKKCHECILC